MRTLKIYRKLYFLVYLFTVLLLIVNHAQAGPPRSSEMDFNAIDSYVSEQVKNLNIPGLALGIVQDDQVVHLQGFGIADSSRRLVTPQTPFYIASVTKSFTALAVMQLVEAGEIDLDKPVQTYLPWFKLADKVASAEITVRHLLNHTSGISTTDGDPDWTSKQSLEEAVRGLGNLSLTQPVGTTYQYSNLNYGIAGLIVQVVSGQPYGDYVTQHIFEPLDMHHSYASRAPALADGLAEGYRYMFGRAFAVEDLLPPVNLPGGGLIVSVEDMTHYAIAHLNGGRYGATSILSEKGIAELHAPASSTGGDGYYAMGWETGKLDGIPFIGHSGALRNFRSQIFLFPDEGWGVVVLANAHGFEQIMQIPEIAKGTVSLLNDQPTTPVSLIFKVRFLYWAILLAPFLMFLGITYSWRYRRNKGIGHILLVVAVYTGIANLWLFGVPRLLGPPFSFGSRIYYPELAYGWITGVILGLGWSVIYTMMNLLARRSK